MLAPGGMLAEGLLSRGSEAVHGNQTQYLNPFERVAYGYQEGYTGQPDAGYQAAVAARPYQGVASPGAIMDILGKIAEVGGRTLGKIQRPR